MESVKIWQNSSNNFYLRDISQTSDQLSPAVYSLEIDPQTGELYLKFIENDFNFEFKLYGLEKDFIERCKKTYENTKGNMGILLNGVKGTGKTITAKTLCNQLRLPVILIQNKFGGMNTFISSIHQDVIILIDEYEKVYPSSEFYDDNLDDVQMKADSSLLSLMDGTYKSSYRRFFMLTTNNLWINDNLLNRPGRLRYKKNFNDLNLSQIMEIIDDSLVYPEYKEDIIDFLKPLKIITVDIVKAIVGEVNIYNESPQICCKDLNVESKDDIFKIIKINEDKSETVLADDIPVKFVDNFVNACKRSPSRKPVLEYGNIYIKLFEKSTIKDIYIVNDVFNEESSYCIRFEKVITTHQSFVF